MNVKKIITLLLALVLVGAVAYLALQNYVLYDEAAQSPQRTQTARMAARRQKRCMSS